RMDSRLGALVLEYKRPSLLRTDDAIGDALQQLKDYLIALSRASDTSFVGVLTNGLIAIEVRASAGTITSQSAPERVGGVFLLRLTQHFISLALTALTPENLIRDFCGSQTDGVLFQTARVLNSILRVPQPKTLMLFSEWEEMFRLAHDDQSQQTRIEERRAALAELFAIPITTSEQEYRALFALHTSYAILLKFMAYRTVSDIYLGQTGEDYRSLASAANSPLRTFCSGLEDGEVFRKMGIINLLEGDFFSWYCDRNQWTGELADSIRAIFGILARYEEAGQIFEANEAPDIFRELYQAAVPRVVRSSFGEFYTPYWLAEQVLDSASPKGEWRAIDPCCGSGTFVVAAISRLRSECRAQGLSDRETLKQITCRIAAVDLNPLGVLTTRINYFIHISCLYASASGSLVIPVYLGDAAAIPERIAVEGVECLRFELKTLKTPIKTILPVSLVRDTKRFMELMLTYEGHIRAKKADAAKAVIIDALRANDKKFLVRKAVAELTDNLIELERKGWNGIWARILSNFLMTACLGRFTVVFGNPPWIDWRNLPEGYRERVKAMCIERGLFSGAGRTGGINLNICALISYVSLTNWLAPGGRLAFLMPRELANQASYEGWRRLGGKWHFLAFHDWSGAGHPFDPVREDFMTFIIGSEKLETRSVPVEAWIKKSRTNSKAADWKNLNAAMADLGPPLERVAGQIIPNSTAFTFADDQAELDEFALVAGDCDYIGRQGIEFYPQELLLFRFGGIGPTPGTVWLHNTQAQKSKYRIHRRRVLLETVYLYPVLKGASIGQYGYGYDGLIAAFPYDAADPLRPVSLETLRSRSPLLLSYYEQSREIIEQQTKYTDKIRGPEPGEFYGLARTGPYTFANVHVAVHDNTKWGATVVTDTDLPWKKRSPFLFQKHAVSMCERKNGDGFITEDEAHFVCAILNTPIVERFILATSDRRPFKIRPPVFVPLYDAEDDRHLLLAAISKKAHLNPELREQLRIESERIYLTICGDEAFDAMVTSDRLDE
ncbi:MAG TPA: N-6 DNA methylase, partial [Thermoanaerobaculia bacterium]|nr:N-6 DNA methylase [Thermoanaerobaculia bacterium]